MMIGEEVPEAWVVEAIGSRPAGGRAIVGRGLWGPTVALGDGSLLKLVRRSAGIGDGRDICANEARVLAALGGGPVEGLTLPRLIGHGVFAPATSASGAGFAAWLRMTRVPGSGVDETALAALPSHERDRFAASLGRSIACLQRDATRIAADRLAGLDERIRSLLLALPKAGADREERDLADILLAAVDAMPAARRGGFVHGDAHLQNLMVDDDFEVRGFIDFAEGGRGFREIDLAYLHWLPEIAEPVRRSYEAIAGPIDPVAYRLAGAIYALTGCVIARQRGEDADSDRAILEGCLAALALGRRSPTPPPRASA